MKLSEVLEQVKKEKPHGFSEDDCTRFLNEAEAQVQELLNIPESDRMFYVWKVDGGTELVVKPPYSNLYVSYVKARIDYANEEYESYANNVAQYEEDFESFRKWAVKNGKIEGNFPRKCKNWW